MTGAKPLTVAANQFLAAAAATALHGAIVVMYKPPAPLATNLEACTSPAGAGRTPAGLLPSEHCDVPPAGRWPGPAAAAAAAMNICKQPALPALLPPNLAHVVTVRRAALDLPHPDPPQVN